MADGYLKAVEAAHDADAGRQLIAQYFVTDRGRIEDKLEIVQAPERRDQILRCKVDAGGDIRCSRN